MTSVRRTVAGSKASALSFGRDPFTLALLVVLPVLSIQLFGVSMRQFPEEGFFETTGSLELVGQVNGAVFAAGALAGVLGLFQMISARAADGRLAISGFRGVELVAARVVTVTAASGAVGVVSTASLAALAAEPVGSLAFVFVGLALAGICYGFLGIVVGSVLPRELEGSLLLVILADVDNVIASGLFGIDEGIARFAPLFHPHEIVSQAVTDGSLATGHLLPAIGHVALFAALAVGAYTVRVETGGDSR